MAMADAKPTGLDVLGRDGAVAFQPEQSEAWRDWLRRATEIVDQCVAAWARWDDKTRREEFSMDDLWVNVNNIDRDDIRDFPPGKARDLIFHVLEGPLEFPCAQATVLLPGYPAGAPGIGRDSTAYLEHGNLHIDGAGTRSPAGLIVGVLISDLRAGIGSGQPLHIPGSHRIMVGALEKVAACAHPAADELSTRQIRATVDWLREECGDTRAIYGKAGTVYVYHGALIHGMAPNTISWPRRREAIYFRFPYPNPGAAREGRFLRAVQAGWELSGLKLMDDTVAEEMR
jgi:hypothetical protein